MMTTQEKILLVKNLDESLYLLQIINLFGVYGSVASVKIILVGSSYNYRIAVISYQTSLEADTAKEALDHKFEGSRKLWVVKITPNTIVEGLVLATKWYNALKEEEVLLYSQKSYTRQPLTVAQTQSSLISLDQAARSESLAQQLSDAGSFNYQDSANNLKVILHSNKSIPIDEGTSINKPLFKQSKLLQTNLSLQCDQNSFSATMLQEIKKSPDLSRFKSEFIKRGLPPLNSEGQAEVKYENIKTKTKKRCLGVMSVGEGLPVTALASEQHIAPLARTAFGEITVNVKLPNFVPQIIIDGHMQDPARSLQIFNSNLPNQLIISVKNYSLVIDVLMRHLRKEIHNWLSDHIQPLSIDVSHELTVELFALGANVAIPLMTKPTELIKVVLKILPKVMEKLKRRPARR